MSVAVGQKAPDFEAKDQTGSGVSLSGLLSDSAVVLYFYPKDETPG